ncbi:hypothetical protein [Paraburkholderia sp. BL25I1N1]|uniref:hypothetical protein n=1 Tax=Paraburkholderia sp. BL25I1N1 TaxID=1938804 RepID=UPI0011B261BD|nr:hypothetical protein [Paraburkholderia sp. BL25I1N1]
MISLLYKPIICLGPRFAPAADAGHMFFVALTAQANNGTEYLNRIYRMTANKLISRSPFQAVQYSSRFPLGLILQAVQHRARVFAHSTLVLADIKPIVADFCALPHRQHFLLKRPNVR